MRKSYDQLGAALDVVDLTDLRRRVLELSRPTKGDIDRALSTLMHDARHRCTALMLPAKQLSVGS